LNGPDDLRAKRGENDCLRANACGAPRSAGSLRTTRVANDAALRRRADRRI